MIGNPDWFQRRKYGGWGIRPKTWQGWVYIIIFVAIIFGIQYLPFLNTMQRTIGTIFLCLVLIIDTIDIMRKLKMDEREKIHEALAERNALYGIIAVLAIGVAYQAGSSVIKGTIEIDWIIVAALFAGLIIKAITNIYLDRKN